MSHVENPEFGKLRAFFWPVRRYELKKLIPMLLIFFFISFDYNVLRTLKDGLVITAKSSGAEVIPFIKVWVLFPGAVLMTFLFTRLSNRFTRETVFYTMTSLFLGFFFLFAFILYPNRESLHPHALADSLQMTLPEGFKGLIAMFRHWTFTGFYVMSELWGNIILSLLFWGFANQVTRLHEAKRFYGLFGIGANFSGVAAGQTSVYLCRHIYNPNLPFGTDAWGQSLVMLVSLVLLAGFLALFLFWWMNKKVLNQSIYSDQPDLQCPAQENKRLSMRESISYLVKSPYLLSIAVIVIAYNLVINLVEVVWKHEVSELYPDPNDFSVYMNQVITWIGVIATLTALFITGNAIRRVGWTFTALLTPVILLTTSIGFFTFFFLKEGFSDTITLLLGTSPLALVVFFGSMQNCLCRAAKYSVFDATKEMAFVPLSPECKLKGKAVIDGMCSRLGKSGGSVIHQGLLIIFATIPAGAPYVAAFLLAIIALWTYATASLGKKFTALTTQKPLEPAAANVKSEGTVLATA